MMKNLIVYEVKKNDTVQHFVKVNKALARKAYNYNIGVYFVPCKLRPFTPWSTEILIVPTLDISFESYIDQFALYNCSRLTGNYISFYISVGAYFKLTGKTV